MGTGRLDKLDKVDSLLSAEMREDLETALENLDELERRLTKATRAGIETETTAEDIETERKRIRNILNNA